MPDLQATVTLNVQGWPELRREVAQIIRDVAATEQDARVAARLHEVAALVAQETSAREAKRVAERVVTHSPRADREMQANELREKIAAQQRIVDAFTELGGKA